MKQESTFKRHSFWMTALIISISILVFCTIGISYIQYNNKIKSSLKDQTKLDLAKSNRIITDNIQMDVQNIRNDMHKLVLPLELGMTDSSHPVPFKELLAQQSNQNLLGSLAYYSVAELEKYKRQNSGDSKTRGNIDRLIKGEDLVIVNPSDANAIILMCIAVRTDKEVIGAVVNTYTVKETEKLFVFPTFDKKGTAYLISKDGEVLVSSSSGECPNLYCYLESASFHSGSTLSDIQTKMANHESGIVYYTPENSSEAVYAYFSPLDAIGLYLYNILPASVAEANIQFFTGLANSLITTIIIIFLALILFILAIQALNNTKFRKNQEFLLLEKERYDTILNHSQGTIWEYYIDTDVLIKSDPDVGIHSGLSEIPHLKDYLLNKQLIFPDDVSIFEQFCNDMRKGLPEIYAEIRAKDISGDFVWFSLSGITIYDQYNIPVSVIGQSLNINQKKLEIEELRDNSKRDSLTRLYNRSAIEELITSYLTSDSKPLIHAFFMLDIDDFKSINDAYGHIFGDAVLIELSSSLDRAFRGKHVVGRLGGDEFAVFLYDVPSISYVKDKAEKISRMFKKIFAGENGEKNISGSIGISIYPNDGTTFEQLLEKADIALYHSKSLGKNCYSIYSPETMSAIIHKSPQKDSPESSAFRKEHSIIDSSIVSNTVEILFDARQLSISIKMILALIGNYYDLGSITIFEQSDDCTTIDITYEWISETGRGFGEYSKSYPIEIADSYVFYRTSSNGIFYHNDPNTIPLPLSSETEFLRSMDIKAILQCAIYNQGSYQGFICFNIYSQGRRWSKPEIDSLALLSKILGAHILKLRTEKTARLFAQRDPLTGAFNFFQFIEEAAAMTKKNPQNTYIVAYTDINKFKFINDTYGYGEGDRVLIEMANILEKSTDEEECFGRVSGDKFIILLKYTDKPSLLRRLRHLNKLFNSIEKTENDYFKLSVIFGLYIITDSSNMTVNIDRANIARKSITDRHKTTFTFFDESMKSRLLKQKEIEDVMEESLRKEEFVVYYQPKIDLRQNKICGAEALIRWNRPGIGLVPPDEFIPIFEENGFIVEIDYYVFDRVCRKIRNLLDEEKHVVPISVNFSRVHLKDRTLVNHLTSVIHEYDIPADLIEIELTESALVADNAYLITLLNEIRSNGFRLSMDDFGSGLSSLNLLRKFPFDVLKIDKEFFQEGTSTNRERVVIANVVKMAMELDMEIVSEGVETEEQVAFLKSIHCPVAQGFFFAKPLPEDEFEDNYC